MKLTEITYMRRFNLGNYEHEEISVSAAPVEGETCEQVLEILKMKVEGSPREKRDTPVSSTGGPLTSTPKPQSPQSNLGSYIIPMGKFKDQRLDQVDMFELDNYCKWLNGQGSPKGKGKELLSKAEEYLKSREFKK